MKVQELIEELMKQDPNAPVEAFTAYESGDVYQVEVSRYGVVELYSQ